jgi:C-terminal processing protease CtpA/Prc
MKKLLFPILVATSALAAAVVAAQTPTPTRAPDANADEARLRTDLDAARKRLDEAAREVAELSGQLGTRAGRDFFFVDGNGPRRAILGVQIDPQGSKDGARILSVSPGGAAEEAGLLGGDVIVNLDGKKIVGAPDANRAVVDHMRDVKPEQKVKVKVLRDGKNKDFVVVARPMAAFAGNRMFNIRVPGPGPGPGPAMGAVMTMPDVRDFPGFWHGEFGGMELASITPRLGAYFGVSEGVLVVQSPENAAFKLEDGDVIQSIDGRKPEDGGHALRILRSYKSGEKLNLTVLRQRKPLTLAVTMPERPAFDEHFMGPPMPAAPLPPPAPPGAKGSFE